MVSASRRTDLLAFAPERLIQALEGRLPFSHQLRPERVHTLLISTKDFRNFLDLPDVKTVCSRCDQVCFNLTITGLGGSPLESGVPHMSLLLHRLSELAEAVGDPRRITWCFDPILEWNGLSNKSKELFESIAMKFAAIGARRVMAMFYFPYRNSHISPDEIPSEEKVRFAGEIDQICASLDLELSFCHIPGMHRLRCVDLRWFAELHPQKDASVIPHYKTVKRPTANYCRDAIWDLGWYKPSCQHGCLYCYGRSNVKNSDFISNFASRRNFSQSACDITFDPTHE